MKKTLFPLLFLCLLSWTKLSAQIKPNLIWEKDFVDTCVVIPLGVDFGLCAMPLGWALSDSGCVMLSGCSMTGSNGIDYSTSFFQSSYQCNGACIQDTTVLLACIDSSLIDLNVLCPGIYEPVCGCDSITYSNSCAAMYHGGVVSYTPGTCESAGIFTKWMALVSIQPNPFTSSFSLIFGSQTNATVKLYQSNGVVISTQQIETNAMEFYTELLSPGIYFIDVTEQSSGRKFSKRIIKQ
ncbi:MAG: T9SS type A sorting domain-containing protein [Flavobacteriia bacterium]